MLRPTPGDPWGVEQHHWNTGAEENQQLNPGGPGRVPGSIKKVDLVSKIRQLSNTVISVVTVMNRLKTNDQHWIRHAAHVKIETTSRPNASG